MQPIRVPPLTETQHQALDELYRTSKVPRLCTRAQMVFLSAEQGFAAHQIAQLVRESENTVQPWLRRYLAEGGGVISDEPHK